MKTLVDHLRPVVLTVLLLAPCLALTSCGDPEEQAVKAAFDSMFKACDDNDGATATSLIASGSLEWYDRLLAVAVSGNRQVISNLATAERLEVTFMRACCRAPELRKLDGRGWMTLSVNRGLYHINLFADDEDRPCLGRVKVSALKDSANAVVEDEGLDKPRRLDFVKEDGVWKIATMRDDTQCARLLEKAAKELNMTMDSVIFLLASRAAGERIDESIWDKARY